jgi:hypothetical protein
MTIIYRQPKGSCGILGGIITGILGGIIGIGIACLAGWICWNNGGGGGGGTVSLPPGQCFSQPNACGMLSIGTLVGQCPSGYTNVGPDGSVSNGGQGGTLGGGGGTVTCYQINPDGTYVTNPDGSYATITGTQSCNATPPSNNQCPPPVVSAFSASPTVVSKQGHTTLSWDVTNATRVTITGDNGFSYQTDVSSSTPTGSTDSGPLDTTTTFTLTAFDGTGGPAESHSVRVVVSPTIKEI